MGYRLDGLFKKTIVVRCVDCKTVPRLNLRLGRIPTQKGSNSHEIQHNRQDKVGHGFAVVKIIINQPPPLEGPERQARSVFRPEKPVFLGMSTSFSRKEFCS